MSWGAMLAPIAGAAMGLIGRDGANAEQVRQQKKLNDVNAATSKELADYQWDKQFAMQEATAAPWQVEQLKKAGLSVGLMYGGSGAGGQVGGGMPSAGGGNADGGAAQMGAIQGMGMLGAQMGLMQAQKENIEADTKNKLAGATKTSGVDTDVAGEELKAKQFENAVRSIIGVEDQAQAAAATNARLEAEGGKAWNEYQAWKAAGFGEMETSDTNSPVAKAIKAGFEKTVTEAENAKTEGNIKKATEAIEEFKAGLARQGIAPDSPWYVKILGDLAGKFGIDVVGATKGAVKAAEGMRFAEPKKHDWRK